MNWLYRAQPIADPARVMKERRVGRFYLPDSIRRDAPELWAAVIGSVLTYYVEWRPDMGCYMHYAYAPFFDKVADGEESPLYQLSRLEKHFQEDVFCPANCGLPYHIGMWGHDHSRYVDEITVVALAFTKDGRIHRA